MALSALDLMGRGVLQRVPFTRAELAGMMVVDTMAGFLGSIALGEVYGRYSHLDGWKGKLAKHSPSILGGVGKVAEALLTLTVGSGWATGLAGSLGQVGVNAGGLEIGLDHARKDLGIAVVKVPAGTDVRTIKKGDAIPSSTALGALPAAAPGRGVAWDHIQELQQMH